MAIEAPGSNLRGAVHFSDGVPEVQVDSAGVQARDLLAWWRAFEPGVDEGLTIEQYFTGSTTVRGWPPRIENLAFSSNGGAAKIPGVEERVWIGAVRGGRERERLAMEPVRLQLGGEPETVLAAARRRASVALHNAGDLTASEDFAAHEGGLEIEAQVDQIATVLRGAAAIGRPINHGWDLDGRAQGSMQWDWYRKRGERWSGKIVVSKARLAVAGLNQQLRGQRRVRIRSWQTQRASGSGGWIWDHMVGRDSRKSRCCWRSAGALELQPARRAAECGGH